MAPAEYKTALMAGHNNSSFHSPFLLPCAHILPLFFSPPLEIIQIMRLPPKTNTLLSPHSDHDFVGLFALSMLSNVLKVVYNTRYRIYTDPIPHACATLSSKRTREVRTTHPCRFFPSLTEIPFVFIHSHRPPNIQNGRRNAGDNRTSSSRLCV